MLNVLSWPILSLLLSTCENDLLLILKQIGFKAAHPEWLSNGLKQLGTTLGI